MTRSQCYMAVKRSAPHHSVCAVTGDGFVSVGGQVHQGKSGMNERVSPLRHLPSRFPPMKRLGPIGWRVPRSVRRLILPAAGLSPERLLCRVYRHSAAPIWLGPLGRRGYLSPVETWDEYPEFILFPVLALGRQHG